MKPSRTSIESSGASEGVSAGAIFPGSGTAVLVVDMALELLVLAGAVGVVLSCGKRILVGTNP